MEAVEDAAQRREHQEARELQGLRQYRLCSQNHKKIKRAREGQQQWAGEV